MDGQVLHAIEFCQQYYPRQIIATGALCGAKEHQDWTYSSQQIELSFQLHCQHFIELVRQDKQADALSYAQNILSPFGLHFPHLLPTLRVYLKPHILAHSHTLKCLGYCRLNRVSASSRVTGSQVFIGRTPPTSSGTFEFINTG
jgi:hypothetical protein